MWITYGQTPDARSVRLMLTVVSGTPYPACAPVINNIPTVAAGESRRRTTGYAVIRTIPATTTSTTTYQRYIFVKNKRENR